MKILRLLLWLVALLPLAAAGYWASFAARLPEPLRHRLALGDAPTCSDFSAVLDVGTAPLHVVPRALELAALQVPGATIASVVWLAVLLAVVLAALLAGVVRRALPIADAGAPLTLLVLALLVASPAHGANWLHGERVGAWLAPTLFAAGLYWLSGSSGFAWRWSMALLAAAAAPFCHANGALVPLALVPATIGASRRCGRSSGAVPAIALLVLGVGAAGYAHWHTPSFGIAGSGWFGALGATPLRTLAELLRATGGAWPDLLPFTSVDELVVGAASWLVPLLFWRVGDRSSEATAVAAPFWSFLCFGLGVVFLAALRYELAPPVGTLREATLGSFLVPVGVVGVVAARCGHGLLAFGAGAVGVLALQGWRSGLEELRLAVLRADRFEAQLSLPESVREGQLRTMLLEGATPSHLLVDERVRLAKLAERGWVPALDAVAESAAVEAFAAGAASGVGVLLGGDAKHLRGEARGSLRLPSVQWVQLVVREGDAAARVVGFTWIDYADAGRTVPWQVALEQPLPEGAVVRAVGFTPRDRRFVALGAPMVVRDGKLVAETP